MVRRVSEAGARPPEGDVLPRGALARPGRAGWTRRFVRHNGATLLVYAVLAGLVIYTSIRSADFRTAANFETLLSQSIVLGLASIGQLIVILAGGIDMSVGMNARFTALIAATLLGDWGGEGIPVLIVVLAIGVAIGCANGLVVTRTGGNPFIITLGTFGVLAGASLAVTSGTTGLVPGSFRDLYTAKIGGFPVAVIVMAAVWVLAGLFLRYLRLGRHIYAVGGSATVARLSGVRIDAVRVTTYAISGFLSVLAGLYLLEQSGVGSNSLATNLEFESIVAVTLGGASLFGGRGNIVGTLGAVLLLTVIVDIFQVLNLNPNYENVFQGGIIIAAIALYGEGRRTARGVVDHGSA